MYKDKRVRVARREGDVSGRRRECLTTNVARAEARAKIWGSQSAFPGIKTRGASYLSRKNLRKFEQLACDGLNS